MKGENMKKCFLFYLLCISTLSYPLTNADWRAIYTIKAGSIATGATIGGFLGYQGGSYLGRHVVPAAAFTTGRYLGRYKYRTTPASPAQRGVLESKYHAQMHRTFKRGFEQSDYSPWQLASAAIISGGSFGNLAASRLAITYIARKYGVDEETAWQAIKENLDLEKVK